MSKFSSALVFAGIIAFILLLGILDNTVIQWPLEIGIFMAIEVLCFLFLRLRKVNAAFLPSLSLTALLCCLLFWINYQCASSKRTEIKVPVQSKGCNGCERAELSVHHPFVVVQYEGKSFELAFSSTEKEAVDRADSCRVFITKGMLGFEFVQNWRL